MKNKLLIILILAFSFIGVFGIKRVLADFAYSYSAGNNCQFNVQLNGGGTASMNLSSNLGSFPDVCGKAYWQAGNSCQLWVPYGSVNTVNFTAVPGTATNFAGYSGSCDSATTCSKTFTCSNTGTGFGGSFETFTANFTQAPAMVETVGGGFGSGSVTSSDNQLNCLFGSFYNSFYNIYGSGACSEGLNISQLNVQITLTATPASDGSTFDSWTWPPGVLPSGTLCNGGQTANTCTLNLSPGQSYKVEAVFDYPPGYTLNVIPPSGGTITTSVLILSGGDYLSGNNLGSVGLTAIDCGIGGNVCSVTYPAGDQVGLSEAAAAGYSFDSWTGDASGNGGAATAGLTMYKNLTVGANFVSNSGSPVILTVSKSGTGSGTATSTTGGINCGSNCSANFISGSLVNLDGTPDSGSYLAGCSIISTTPDGTFWKEATANAGWSSNYSQTLVFNDGSGNKLWYLGSGGDPAQGANIAGYWTGMMEFWKSANGTSWSYVWPNTVFYDFGKSSWFSCPSFGFSSSCKTLGSGYSSFGAPTPPSPYYYVADYGENNSGVYYSVPNTSLTGYSSLAFLNKMFIIAGKIPGSGAVSDVWESSDGITWIDDTYNEILNGNPSFGARQGQAAVVFSGGVQEGFPDPAPQIGNAAWILGGNGKGINTSANGTPGYNVTGYLNDIYFSNNGGYWISNGNANWSPRANHGAVVFNGKIWVMGGRDASGLLNDVWYTSDAVNWTQATAAAAWPARSDFQVLSFGGRMWVIGGLGATGVKLNDVWSSVDGVNWTQATIVPPSWSGRYDFSASVFNNTMWVLGGNKPSSFTNDSEVWDAIVPAAAPAPTLNACSFPIISNTAAAVYFNKTPFDYSLANSGDINVWPGTSGSNIINQTLINGTSQLVTLTVSGLPSGAGASFTGSPCGPNCSSGLSISTPSSAVIGTYPITVTGTPLNKTTTFNLIVSAPPAISVTKNVTVIFDTLAPTTTSLTGTSTSLWKNFQFKIREILPF